ncbi:MAG: hypothetical protein AAGH67_06635 [Cyanobacteria bacterium P01_H01_bin.162]
MTIEAVTGVNPHDADRAEGAASQTTSLIMGALLAANLMQGPRQSPQSEESDPQISIQVGDQKVESPLSQLPDVLEHQSDEFLEPLRAAIQDPERPEGAPVVEIYADDKLKFYRNDETTFSTLDFDLKPHPQSQTEALTVEVADFLTDGIRTAENPDPTIHLQLGSGAEAKTISTPSSQLAEEINSTLSPDEIESLHGTLIDGKPSDVVVSVRDESELRFYAEGRQRLDLLSESVAATRAAEAPVEVEAEVMPAEVSSAMPTSEEPPASAVETMDVESETVEAAPVAPTEAVEEVASPQVVQISVSQAEALGGQTLAESSTVNPDVWEGQTQTFTAEVDQFGHVQPTTSVGQSVDAIADQVALTEQAEVTADKYAEQLEVGRDQVATTAEAHDDFFDQRRETSDIAADKHDEFYDQRRARADATGANGNPDAMAEVPEKHHQIAGMLDQACSLCFEENTGTQTIEGRNYVIDRDGDFLSVTAKDGRGVILVKDGEQISSSLTSQDEQNFALAVPILQQQQARQRGQAAGPKLPSTPQPVAASTPKGLELE